MCVLSVRALASTRLTISVHDFSALENGSSLVYFVQTDGSDNQLSHKFEEGSAELTSQVFVVRASAESSCTGANTSGAARPSKPSSPTGIRPTHVQPVTLKVDNREIKI